VDVSVVVPVFNGGSKIERCVRCLKRQRTKRNFEIIIVDDGSTDGCLQRIGGPRIRVLTQANHGPAAARNLGVEESRGNIVLFTDSDCEPFENWIEEMVAPFENPGISGVKGSYRTCQRGIVPLFVQLEYEDKYDRMKKDRTIDFIDTYSAAFLKRALLAAGRFDPSFPVPSVEDQEFSFRLWEKGYQMVFNPKAMVYHTHSETVWDYVKKKFRIGYWKALVLRKHPKKIMRDSHTPQSLKAEMILVTMSVFCLLLSIVEARFLLYGFVLLAGFLTAISPFVIKSFRKNRRVALFSPFLLLVRALSLSFGLLIGAVRFAILRRETGGPVSSEGP
jgi:glycosyltransferase involved in cell wall biosynthesis